MFVRLGSNFIKREYLFALILLSFVVYSLLLSGKCFVLKTYHVALINNTYVEEIPVNESVKNNYSLNVKFSHYNGSFLELDQTHNISDTKYRLIGSNDGEGKPVHRLPDALVIGVKKSGTRALLEFLRIHPDVRAAGSEVHFFDRYYLNGLNWYRRRMPSTIEGQVTIEKTPSYFITREAPARVMEMNPKTKLLLVVRDPVTRALSDYAQAASKRKNKSSMQSFEELAFLKDSRYSIVDTTWGPVRIGVYCRYLNRWLRYFPLNQMLFVSGEQLISDPAAEMFKVQEFLGIKRIITEKHFFFNSTKGFPCLVKSERRSAPHCLGKTKGRDHPKISTEALTRLREFYRPFNLKFYEMTRINFGWP